MSNWTDRVLDLFGRPLPKGKPPKQAAVDASPFSATPQSKAGWAFLVVHPFLLAVIPILHLYSQNIYQAPARIVLLFLAAALAQTAIVFLAVWLWLRDLVRTALLVFAFNLMFYVYGRMFDLLMRHEPFALSYRTWHIILISAACGILLVSGFLLRRTRRNLLPLARFLSVALSIMLIFTLGPIVRYEWRCYKATLLGKRMPGEKKSLLANRPKLLEKDSAESPDVYYIILDSYARSDTLKRLFQYDNRQFVSFLRSRGFYVADESCSNYPFTEMSLASSLNMCYLDELLPPQTPYPNPSLFYALLEKGAVPTLFQQKGYRFVHFATNFKPAWDSADTVFRPQPAWLQSEFSQVLLRTTALRLLETNMAEQHLYEFENIKSVANINGPTFAFCHVIAPHPPYVFDRDGHVKSNVPQSMLIKECNDGGPYQDDARQSYIDQLIYVNKRVEEDIDAILARSPTRPVIIVQGDHGSYFTAPDLPTDEKLDEFSHERLPILNAYYVPDKVRAKLYPSISPVNTFRLLFNECFGEHFEMLAQKHMIGTYLDKYHLRDATAIVDPEAAKTVKAVHSVAPVMLTSH